MAKTVGVVVGGLGRQKMGVSSFAHMLICSLLLLYEHLFTFQLCALMPKISKENVVDFSFHSTTVTIATAQSPF